MCYSNAICAPTSLERLGGHLQTVLFYTNNCLLLSDCICFLGLCNSRPQAVAEKTEIYKFWRSEAWNHGVGRVGSFWWPEGESVLCLSPGFWWFPATPGISWPVATSLQSLPPLSWPSFCACFCVLSSLLMKTPEAGFRVYPKLRMFSSQDPSLYLKRPFSK